VCLSSLLIVSGDIESSPGPNSRGGRNSRINSSSQPVGNVHVTDSQEYVGTRYKQRTLQSYTLSQQVGNRRASVTSASDLPGRSGMSSGYDEESMFDLLRQIKIDLAAQNENVSKNISKVNDKIDSISETIRDVRTRPYEKKIAL